MKVDFDLSNLDLLQDVRLCNNTISSKFCQEGLSSFESGWTGGAAWPPVVAHDDPADQERDSSNYRPYATTGPTLKNRNSLVTLCQKSL